jgi:hypothetical protein
MIRAILFKNHISKTILIDNREVSIISPELSAPITLKIDKLKEQRSKIKGQLTEKELDDIINLKNEREIFEEIVNDYLREGWKLTSKDEW